MQFARSKDGKSMVVYVELEPNGPHVRSYFKLVLSYNRADALHRALGDYLAEQAPPSHDWLLGDTDG
jgi:hypothetical protein